MPVFPKLTKEFINYKPFLEVDNSSDMEELLKTRPRVCSETLDHLSMQIPKIEKEKKLFQFPVRKLGSLNVNEWNIGVGVIDEEEEVRGEDSLIADEVLDELSPEVTPNEEKKEYKFGIIPTQISTQTLPPLQLKDSQHTHFLEAVESSNAEEDISDLVKWMFEEAKLEKSIAKIVRVWSLIPEKEKYITKVEINENFWDELTEGVTSKKKQKVLILDLDNTLIQTLKEASALEYYQNNPDKLEVIMAKDIPFLMRPFLLEFLKCMKRYYKIVVFTAAGAKYAQKILTKIQLLAGEKLFECVYSQRNIVYLADGIPIKRLLGGIKEKMQVILDDNILLWFHCPKNYVPIVPFRGQSTDRTLISVASYLIMLAHARSIHSFNRKHLRISHTIKKLHKALSFTKNSR